MRRLLTCALCLPTPPPCLLLETMNRCNYWSLLLNIYKVCTCIYTSVKIIKNEVGCRDDTVPKTVDTRRHATIFRNPQKLRCRDWVAEDCYMFSLLLAVHSCIYSFWHSVIPTSYFIFNDFYTCFTNFLSLTVARGEMPYVVRALHV